MRWQEKRKLNEAKRLARRHGVTEEVAQPEVKKKAPKKATKTKKG